MSDMKSGIKKPAALSALATDSAGTAGQLFIVSAPSGAGKTTLVRKLLEQYAQIELSISFTTRAPRPGERDGIDYHFVSRSEFDAMRERGDFLEWAEVHDNCYATSRVWLESEMKSGRDVLLEIDWQGASQVRKALPQAIGIFVLPPSLEELERRLRGRGSDAAEVIRRRLDAALGEMRRVDEFEYCIINNDLDVATADLVSVVRGCRSRLPVQKARHPASFGFLKQED